MSLIYLVITVTALGAGGGGFLAGIAYEAMRLRNGGPVRK